MRLSITKSIQPVATILCLHNVPIYLYIAGVMCFVLNSSVKVHAYNV